MEKKTVQWMKTHKLSQVTVRVQTKVCRKCIMEHFCGIENYTTSVSNQNYLSLRKRQNKLLKIYFCQNMNDTDK